ncbi:MAG: helix-turn-helix transcriptional regulator [Hyphomicrobiaceae bacterium]|nr:helix-turn-helix transcriptional regulator [Hyphomicrobiaceae bacterium]
MRVEQRGNANSSGAAYDTLIDAVYDLALSPDSECNWCRLLGHLCREMNASIGEFLLHDRLQKHALSRHSFSRPDNLSRHGEQSPAGAAWRNSSAVGGEGEVFLSGGTDRQTLHQRRNLTSFQHLWGVVTLDRNHAYLISLLRAPGTAPFGIDDKAFLERLLPHLKRSRLVRDRLRRDERMRESMADLIDRLPVAFLLVRADGAIEFANRQAQTMLHDGNGISTSADGRITTQFPRDTEELRQLIRRTAQLPVNGNGNGRGNGNGHDGGHLNGHDAHLMIARHSGRLPLVCALHPANDLNTTTATAAERSVALLIKDPDIDAPVDLSDFAAVYQLTKAETRLTRLLVDGYGLFEAAEKLGVTKNTARTHMRNIYSKIGSNRQADLIRLHGQLRFF